MEGIMCSGTADIVQGVPVPNIHMTHFHWYPAVEILDVSWYRQKGM